MQLEVTGTFTGFVCNHHQVTAAQIMLIDSEIFAYLSFDAIALKTFPGNPARHDHTEARCLLSVMIMHQNPEVPVCCFLMSFENGLKISRCFQAPAARESLSAQPPTVFMHSGVSGPWLDGLSKRLDHRGFACVREIHVFAFVLNCSVERFVSCDQLEVISLNF